MHIWTPSYTGDILLFGENTTVHSVTMPPPGQQGAENVPINTNENNLAILKRNCKYPYSNVLYISFL